MILTNKNNLPAPFMNRAKGDYVKAGDISVTEMISPIQQRQLKIRYSAELTEDVSDRIWMILGSAVHAILETGTVEQEYITERRFRMNIAGKELSGTADLIEGDVMSDYKVTSVWSIVNANHEEWEKQLNIYKLLAKVNLLEIRKLQVVAILRDWSKNKSGQGNYPTSQVVIVPIEVWSPNRVFEYTENRITQHYAADNLPDNELPECTPDEMWERPTKYAVKKPKRKSAIRVLDTNEDAEAYIKEKGLDDKHFIEVRPGERVRCEGYCSVRDHCNQYKIYKGEK